jgi:hypothetical protein
MKVTSSYAAEVKYINKMLRDTGRIYRDAVSFCIRTFEAEWNILSAVPVAGKQRFAAADHLIHSTRSNTARYPEFDTRYYKMPEYMRFAAINDALGYLSSYHAHLDKCTNDPDCTEGVPRFQPHQNGLPTFYRGNMYREGDSPDTVYLKLFANNDWVWVPVRLKHTDVMSVKKHAHGAKLSCPTLERHNKKWFLRFAFEEDVTLGDAPVWEQLILAVDLGINTDATCSVMASDGTVLAREFIDFASEKDHLKHTLNKVKKVQQQYGPKTNTTRLWRHAVFHNDELAKKTACAIVDLAVLYGCDVIVFEHLDTHGRKRGSKKQRLAMWKKNTVQEVTMHKAHRNGIRVSRICAWGTSKLAYDGSGAVTRGKDAGFATNELCRFPNGKTYNCDLSASYNIGARYFIRELEKSMPVTAWSGIAAKVPQCRKRTQCTYSTLLAVNAAM